MEQSWKSDPFPPRFAVAAACSGSGCLLSDIPFELVAEVVGPTS